MGAVSRGRCGGGRADGAQRGPGRPAKATPNQVLALASDLFLAGERIDLSVIARQLGLGRATVYRWFGSREAVIGEVVAAQLELVIEHHRGRVRRRGAAGLLATLDRVNRTLARSEPLRRLLESERDAALRLLTASSGVTQPRAVAAVSALIEREVRDGRYVPPADPRTLAYAIVRLAEAFLYNDAVAGLRGDCDRLHEVQGALLGVAPVKRQAPRGVRPVPRRRSASAPPSGARGAGGS